MEIHIFCIRMSQIIFALILSAFSIGARLVDHAPNFAAIGALAVWSGIYLPKKLGVALVLATMLISDSIIGFYNWQVMLAVYGSFILMAIIGWHLKNHKGPAVVASSLFGSLSFYIITNFAVWLFSNMYAHNLAGLADCFYLALPFFRNTLYSDLIYGIIFVGAFEAISRISFVYKKKLATQVSN